MSEYQDWTDEKLLWYLGTLDEGLAEFATFNRDERRHGRPSFRFGYHLKPVWEKLRDETRAELGRRGVELPR